MRFSDQPMIVRVVSVVVLIGGSILVWKWLHSIAQGLPTSTNFWITVAVMLGGGVMMWIGRRIERKKSLERLRMGDGRDPERSEHMSEDPLSGVRILEQRLSGSRVDRSTRRH